MDSQVEITRLQQEKAQLLLELEASYKNMATVLEQSEMEMKIAYKELDERYHALEELYKQLSNKENMLIHLEKLSSIGQFISEIIHELNNPLTAISGLIDLSLMEKDLPENVRKRISRLPNEVDRMKNYLNRFKGMAYKGREDFKIFDLNDSLTDFLSTIEIISPKNRTIHADLCKQKLMVEGDPYQIIQIFLNLAKNAFDAMQHEGTTFSITSQCLNKESLLKENFVFCCQKQSDWKTLLNSKSHFALVEVSDDGSGIPSEIIPNLFEAFYTTKGRGKGTGLGLSIASDVTIRHGANLCIKSELGKGTTFFFVMPLAV